ncbi:chromate transporter [Oceanobacillus kimchii]|uniref:chromate transporter n=1 Tax=Oceanobacillus TaxID=182709 RepID=UPI00034A2452|nr:MULTISPECIES: chromate transporter [Oceanobacillus]MBT2599748.1 chromate transporter [Oceanobacillus sp. ISL-74]MCT1576937.1 chromate transporter [Oceanobacillus kimchii]MCT2135007.1 chromate transporter [Oceanobacillus kimchii]OEH56291.1 chromate transporter [Oceanobacillus sp. E9]
MRTHWNIFIAFFRVGMLGFGGGPSSIPLIYKEVVEKYKWMNDEDFGDVLALANTLPGPIATKLAGYIGYQVTGFWGMLNAVLAGIVPTIFLMVGLLVSLSSFREYDWVQGMTAAVIPVVAVMLATLTWQFIEKAGSGMGWLQTGIMLIIVFVLLEMLHIHPGILIATLLAIALLKKNKIPEQEEERTAREGGS